MKCVLLNYDVGNNILPPEAQITVQLRKCAIILVNSFYCALCYENGNRGPQPCFLLIHRHPNRLEEILQSSLNPQVYLGVLSTN